MAIRRSKYMKVNGPTSKLFGDCAIESCPRPMFRSGLCSSHFKRRQRNKPISGLIGEETIDNGLELGEILDPVERVIKTGHAMIECSSEDDDLWRYRRLAFLKATANWIESLGWKAPRDALRRLRNA